MKTALQGVGGLLLAAVLLYVVFRGIDRHALGAALSRVFWPALVAGAAINLGHNVFRILRWRWLLAPIRPGVHFRPMFVAVTLGYMTTWLIPGRIGELVRPALLSAREDLPLGPCLGTVVADRLLDGLAIIALFGVGAMTADFGADSAALEGRIRASALFLLAGMVAGLLILMALSGAGDRLERWLAARSPMVRWLGRVALGLSKGTDALRSPRRALPIALHSLTAWVTIALGTWIGIRAAGADVGFAAVLVMLPLLALGVALPTPGGVGGYHAMMKVGLTSLFGVDPAIATSAGILMHLGIVLPVLALGTALLYTEKISFADVVAAGRHVRSLGGSSVAEGAAP